MELMEECSITTIIEFKEYLYSSPMATPRDIIKGQEGSLPLVEQLLVSSPTPYPW